MTPPLEPQSREPYLDRELSWLSFNQRVLDQALNPGHPLLERIHFLAIVSSNLDEFFEIRVSLLLQKAESGAASDGIAGLAPREKLDRILRQCQRLVRSQYRCWEEDLLPQMRAQKIRIKGMADLDEGERHFVDGFFRREVYPLLTPIQVDPAHPFPFVTNKALYLAVLLRGERKRQERVGVVAIPRSLPRLVPLPTRDRAYGFIFIQDVVRHYLDSLFLGFDILAHAGFRVTRNSNLYLEEEEGSLLIDTVEAEVHNRRRGNVVRLEIDRDAPKRLTELLVKNFDIGMSLVFRVGHPVNLSRVYGLPGMVPRPDLKFPVFTPWHLPRFQEPAEIFGTLRAGDVMLHHPFESFDPVVRFIQAAARDPDVLAIKQTLYRTSRESPIVYALMEAAEAGKEVVVVVELKARFDEASNIQWARQLEERGGTVLYGLVGLKTHCKLVLVLRRENGSIRRYAHVGTGNYNPDTARVYTDLSLLSADPVLIEGVSDVFNFLSAQSRRSDFHNLLVGPVNLLAGILARIEREREHARVGRPSGITVKCNAILDAELIEALYSASQAGVPVRLLVRGICALRPGVKGMSDHIEVKSLVGRFLEHSRIYHFENAGTPEMLIGSSDWMQRNLRERVEVMVPIRAPGNCARLEEILSAYWNDRACVYTMRADGGYAQLESAPEEKAFNVQEWLVRKAEGQDGLLQPPSIFPPRQETAESEVPDEPAAETPAAMGEIAV